MTTAMQQRQNPEEGAGPLSGKPFIARAELKELSRLQDWKSGVQVFLDLGAVVACAVVCELFWHPLLYVPAVWIIGSRLHGLGILMHDAVHYTLFKNKRLNDVFGEVVSNLIFFNFENYRKNHLNHHRYLNAEGDPDLPLIADNGKAFFRGRAAAYWHFAMPMLLGVFIAPFLAFHYYKAAWREKPLKKGCKFGFLGLLLLACVLNPLVLKIWLLYHIIPGFSWGATSNRIRNNSEHHFVKNTHELNQTRSVRASAIERFSLAPNNSYLHQAHHLYPSVPWYNLPKLEKSLRQNAEYRDHSQESSSYLAFIEEVARKRA